MKIVPQISFEGAEPSAATRATILEEIARLEIHHKRIAGCRVTVVAPSQRHRHGPGFEVRILLTIPSREDILVNRTAPDDRRYEHVEVAIKDAFAAARRQLDSISNKG